MLTSDGANIVILDLDGEALQSFGEPETYLFGPVWSPDGKWIAFSRSAAGHFLRG
ncbi:MAG: TolB family protein [Actinomycetota bacterium]